ncbi:MAG: WXG100 family type VII secretion target [Chloroflexota bacterium]
MPNAEIRVTYAELERAQQQLGQLAEQVEGVIRSLNQHRDALSNEWIGFGADAFMREMDEDILPAVGRLAAALTQAESLLFQTGQQLFETEIDDGAQIKAIDALSSPPSSATTQTGGGASPIGPALSPSGEQPAESSVAPGSGGDSVPATGSPSAATNGSNGQSTGSSSGGSGFSDAGGPTASESPTVQAAPSYVGSIPNPELEEKLMEEFNQPRAAGATGPTPILIFDDPLIDLDPTAITPLEESTIPEELSSREIPIHGTPTEAATFTTANGEPISADDLESADLNADPSAAAVEVEGTPIPVETTVPQAGKGSGPQPILVHDDSPDATATEDKPITPPDLGPQAGNGQEFLR